jgi:hypothetical protein
MASHLVAALLLGILINAAHLATKFRRFLHLGVLTNWYSALFLVFGAALCGLAVSFGAIPRLATWKGPWIADICGAVVTLLLPRIRMKTPMPRATASPVRDLLDTASANPLVAVIEDGIRDRILEHMQFQIIEASRRYDWETIKLATRRMLEEEMAIGRLDQSEGEAAIQSVEGIQPLANSRSDENNKYIAMIRVLRCGSFWRLRTGLMVAASETQ